MNSNYSSFGSADFNKIPVGLDKDAIVGITKKVGDLEPAPIWGYEVQFANQQLVELRVNSTKDKYAKIIKEMTGMVVSDSKTGRKSKQANKKVRKSAKEKSPNARKQELKFAKQELKLALNGLQIAKGTSAEEVYLLDVKYYQDKIASLAA